METIKVKEIKSKVYVWMMIIISFMLITTIIRLGIISFGDWYDKGKYFTCQTHAMIFEHASKDMKFEEIEIVKSASKPDKITIKFEEFSVKAEANSYITSWIFGIPISLNSDMVVIDDGDIMMYCIKEVGFESQCDCEEPIDKEQKEKLEENYKDAIDWACKTETRIIIVRFVLLGALMYVVIKKYRKIHKKEA